MNLPKEDRIDRLRRKAQALPRRPGVYIMKDKKQKIIYVGKSRALRDRVSQYFHLPPDAVGKTARMVSLVDDFDFILCDTEIEALTLENSLIKQHSPKYNIKLKDAKSYPYIKVTMQEEFPRIGIVRKRLSDGAKYFGPYTSAKTVYDVIKTLERSLKIPTCKRVFPRDIGKERPCIYKQLSRCVAPCAGDISSEQYKEIMKAAVSILRGNTKEAIDFLEDKMLSAAEDERFEEAARCRDSIQALKKLGEGQKVVGSPDAEFDIIALYSDKVYACASVFYIRSGVIYDSEFFIFGADEILTESEETIEKMNKYAESDDSEMSESGEKNEPQSEGAISISSFIAELYMKREYVPHEILLSFEMENEEREALSEYLKNQCGHRVYIRTPERGDMKKLCAMVYDNAKQNVKNHRVHMENDSRVLVRLASMLALETVPERIECYDISNLGSEHITAGMIVAVNGKLKKSDYRVFKMKFQDKPDDYASMSEAIMRRFGHIDDESGSFSEMPDLILLDGGKGHVSVIKNLLSEMGIDVPVFGMVKDEHHKTRSLTSDEEEISIAREKDVFALIYKLQEEVHRFTISKMEGAKRKTMRVSSLEKIKGIGSVKAKILMDHFGTVTKIKSASRAEIANVKGISESDADAVFEWFDRERDKENRINMQ